MTRWSGIGEVVESLTLEVFKSWLYRHLTATV